MLLLLFDGEVDEAAVAFRAPTGDDDVWRVAVKAQMMSALLLSGWGDAEVWMEARRRRCGSGEVVPVERLQETARKGSRSCATGRGNRWTWSWVQELTAVAGTGGRRRRKRRLWRGIGAAWGHGKERKLRGNAEEVAGYL